MNAIEMFAQCEKRFFSRLVDRGYEASVVYDIGAANGSWSEAIAEVFPNASFELFEPLASRNAEYREVLDERLRGRPNFRVHEIALSDHNGESQFWAAPNAVGSSLVARGMPAEQMIIMPVRRLDDAVERLGLKQPQIIKMDVQAGEALVLKGGVKTVAQADLLHMETWLRRGYGKMTPLLPELIEGLRPLGFVLVHIGDFYREQTQEIASVDAFFAHARLIQRYREAGQFPWPEALG
jgi:FkbM family methyltransferase